MADEKQRLRTQIKARLAALDGEERRRLSALIAVRLIASPEFAAARTVLAYDSAATEVDTRAIQRACLDAGKRLCLPRTNRPDRSIAAHAILDPDRDLVAARFSMRRGAAQTDDFCIREPLETLPIVPPEEIDLAIVPGLAFDPSGCRLGRGGGYYDRFLARDGFRAVLCALAFECQIVARVPAQTHDLPVHLIFTDSQVIRASN